MEFVVGICQNEDGMYIALCPSIPGCASQGETEAEAEVNIAESIWKCLATALFRPREVVRAFERLGWQVARQRGSQIVLTKPGVL